MSDQVQPLTFRPFVLCGAYVYARAKCSDVGFDDAPVALICGAGPSGIAALVDQANAAVELYSILAAALSMLRDVNERGFAGDLQKRADAIRVRP